MGPLQRKDSASCRGAILRPHQLMDELRLWNITGWVGSEGRAQNIAPLQLIRCLIVECGGMEPCVPTCEWLATTDPPRLTAPAVAFSKLRFRLRLSLACCPQYAISDGGFAALRQFDKFDKFDKFVT